MIAATALDKTTMAHEVCDVLSGIELFAGARRRLGQFGAAVCIGDSAYLSTVQLKRIFASQSVQKRYGPTRWGFAAIFKSLPQSRDTLLF